MSAAIPMSMSSFKLFAGALSPDVTVCIQGRHGIGKSQCVYQIASTLRSDFYKDPENAKKWGHKYEDGVPVVERRLSQMTEGDILGLPFSDGESTEFKPVSWLIEACERPVVLFLDERNRALEGVKQAVFQLMDSKAFYGRKLHPETRIFIAENIGEQYTVNQVDPAELSRAAVVALEPTVKDWLAWAEANLSDAVREYILSNERDLEHSGTCEPNTKYPDRRAWAKLDKEIDRLHLYEDPTNPLLYQIAGAFVGPAIGMRYADFCKNRNREVSAADIFKNWTACKKRLGKQLTVAKFVELSEKVVDFLGTTKLPPGGVTQYHEFLKDSPPETIMSHSEKLLGGPNKSAIAVLIPMLMKATGNEVPPDSLRNAEDLLQRDKAAAPSPEETKESAEGVETPAKKRGPGRPKKNP